MKLLQRFALSAFTAATLLPLTSEAYIVQTLNVLPDYTYPDIQQMNEDGVVVGTLLGYGAMGCRWKATSPLAFPSLGPGYAHSAWAYGINNAGIAVGMLDKDGGALHPMMNFPLVPGTGSVIAPHTAPAGATAVLRVINDSGYAVGTYNTSAFYSHPLGFKGTLPVAKVGTSFEPVAINNAGDVLGKGSTGNLVYNLEDGTAVSIASRVPTVVSATAMNELGDVAGVKSGNTAYIRPKPAAAAVIQLGVGKVKAVHAMNDARELLVTTHTNRPALLRPSAAIADGEFVYLDTVVTAPWTITKLADINNAGSIAGIMRRPATPADATSDAYIVRGFRLVEFILIFPIFP